MEKEARGTGMNASDTRRSGSVPGNKAKPTLNSDSAKQIFHASVVNIFPPYFSSNDSL